MQHSDAVDGIERYTSTVWERGALPRLSVVVSTYNRAAFARGLIDALTRQHVPHSVFEVVVVDNGSTDSTWATVREIAASTSLRLIAARLPTNRGPAGGRNTAASLARGEYLVFTDDDCLPGPGWLEAVGRAFDTGATIVQGRTIPDPSGADTAGPWARTIVITKASSMFETCNIAYRRAAFDAVGGFDENDPLTAGRPFGEDVILGTRVVERGGAVRFAPDALVYHRYLPASYADWLTLRRNLVGFPGLARRSRVFADAFWHRVFLNREHAAFDVGLVSVVAGAVTRNPLWALGFVPWAYLRWPAARWRPGSRPVRLAQLALGDLVEVVSLLEGSVRHRRLLL